MGQAGIWTGRNMLAGLEGLQALQLAGRTRLAGQNSPKAQTDFSAPHGPVSESMSKSRACNLCLHAGPAYRSGQCSWMRSMYSVWRRRKEPSTAARIWAGSSRGAGGEGSLGTVRLAGTKVRGEDVDVAEGATWRRRPTQPVGTSVNVVPRPALFEPRLGAA